MHTHERAHARARAHTHTHIYIYIYIYIYIFLLRINGFGSYSVKYVLEKYYGVNKKLTPNVFT